jgi:hypothetical protein
MEWQIWGNRKMGYGTVIAGIYFTTILLTASYVFVDSVNRTSTSSASSFRDASSIEVQKLRSSCSIASLSVSGRNTLYLDLQNIGDVKVVRSDYWKIDVLLRYQDSATYVTATYWCYYNSADTSKHRWQLDPGVTPNPSPNVVNPLDWDPDETLSIVINLPSGTRIRSGTSGYVTIALPSGVTCGRTFSV